MWKEMVTYYDGLMKTTKNISYDTWDIPSRQ
jgi:hypothetical protein